MSPKVNNSSGTCIGCNRIGVSGNIQAAQGIVNNSSGTCIGCNSDFFRVSTSSCNAVNNSSGTCIGCNPLLISPVAMGSAR